MAQFRKQLITYLQEEGVSYADCRKGGNSKQTENGLEPKVDDFFIHKSGAKIRFGRIAKITKILNVVILTVIKRNKIPRRSECSCQNNSLYLQSNPPGQLY